MSSVLDAPPVRLLGSQTPRLLSLPPYEPGDSTALGDDAIELAALASLDLDPWQQFILRHSLRRRRNGKWAAFEVGGVLPRQNGKGAVLEARELAGLFLLDEQLLLHSAHEFKTAREAFRRIQRLIQGTRDFDRRVKRMYTANGNEMIELKSGQRLQFVARSAGSGRGFSGDFIGLDEAQHLSDEPMAALLPTLSARPNPQVWYMGTAGTEVSIQLGRVRERGCRGNDPSLFFAEWSVDEEDYAAADPGAVALANPSLGIRISLDYVNQERAALSPEAFARERLGVGNWPTDLTDAWQVVSRRAWDALADNDSELEDPVAFAVGVRPDERSASIAVAGRRGDGRLFVEVVEHRPGTSWVTQRMGELDDQWSPCAIVVDVGGPAGSLVSDLENAGLRVVAPQVRQVSDAAEQFYDLVMDSKSLRHLGDVTSQRPLRQALGAATKRPLRDKWTWERRHPTVDMSPLEAVTLAAWGYGAYGTELGPDDIVVRAV
jgi:hypothetical protein